MFTVGPTLFSASGPPVVGYGFEEFLDSTEYLDGSLFRLNTTQALCVYRSSSTAYSAVVITVVDGLPVFGAPVGVGGSSSVTPQISGAALSATKVVIFYGDGGAVASIRTQVLNVSGDVVTVAGSTYLIDANNCTGVKADVLDASRAVVTYSRVSGGSGIYAVAVSVSGDVVTAGSPISVVAAASTAMDVSAVSSTVAAVWYQASGTADGTGICLNIVGTVVSVSGAPFALTSANTRPVPATMDTSGRVGLLWADASNNLQGTQAEVGSTDITYGADTLQALAAAAGTTHDSSAMESTRLLRVAILAGQVVVQLHEVAGVVEPLSEIIQISSASSDNPRIVSLSSSLAVAVWQDTAANELFSCTVTVT